MNDRPRTTAIIADDEPLMRADLAEQLGDLWPELELLAQVESGPQALLSAESLRPDVLFLDMRMPGLTGLEVAKALTVPTQVVFVTAHDDMALQAFGVDAVDYLIKPVEPERLRMTIARLQQNLVHSRPDPRGLMRLLQRNQKPDLKQSPVPDPTPRGCDIAVKTGPGRVTLVQPREIAYFRADSRLVEAVTESFSGTVELTMSELMALDAQQLFLQISDTVFVNRLFIDHIRRVDDSLHIHLKVKSRPKLLVAPNRQGQFKGM